MHKIYYPISNAKDGGFQYLEGKGSNNEVNQPFLWSRKGSTFSLSLNTIIKQYKTLLLVVKNNK